MPDIKNYMEVCVSDMLASTLERLSCCTCEKCQYDIKAIVLNSLPPKYVVTRKGHFYTKVSALHQQFNVDIITAITKAAAIVSQAPRHDESDDD